MGAWGYKPFEDDTALDFLEEVIESDFVELCQSAFEEVIESNYIEYDEGQAAIVSACIIDMIINGTEYEGIEEYSEWVTENKNLEVRIFRSLAVNSLEKIISEGSELNELWEESGEDYQNWINSIKGIIKRLEEK